MVNYYVRYLSPLIVVLLLVAGCGDSSNTTNGQAADKTGVDIQPPIRYSATLAEGIDFKRDGWPDFIASVKGISEKESFGRWTDGDVAEIEFEHDLPNSFNLQLSVAAFSKNIGNEFAVSICGQRKTFIVRSWNPSAMEKVNLPIKGCKGGRKISILVPFPTAPKDIADSPDTRKLGLAIEYLRVVEQ